MIRIAWIAALSLISACMAGCGLSSGGRPARGESVLDAVLARGKLVVGVRRDSPPFGFQDAQGDIWGFDVDLARAIAERLKVRLEIVPVTAADRFEKLRAGAVDLLAASCTITRAREEEVDFSLPYFADQQAFLVKKDSGIKGYLDIAGRTVGAVEGSTSMENLKIVQPDAKPAAFKDYREAFDAFKAGRVDAITSDSMILLGLLGGKRGDFSIVGRFGYEPYGLAVRQDDSRWRDRINCILMELWDDGILQRIYDNWFGEGGRFPAEVEFSMTTYPKGKR